MKQLLKLSLILFFGQIMSQESAIHSVYFKVGKFDLERIQLNNLVDFVNKTDSSAVEAIQIFGYTDDVGNEKYNINLSNKRANYIQKHLMNNGIKTKFILKIEGKGKILLVENIKQNVDEIRYRNRRVDVFLKLKPTQILKPEPKRYFQEILKVHNVGDKINLEAVFFETGSSVLSEETKKELDIIIDTVKESNIYMFEIQGHVCCVPPTENEALDKDTKKRGLSKNRAKAVYDYFVSKNIQPERMTHKGYGNTVPKGKGDEFDRRVEILVTKI